MRGLYAVTPDLESTADLLSRVRAVLAARPALIQYRNKLAPAGLRRVQAEALLAECRACGIPLIVNDDVELALSIAADGVHVGHDDGDVAQVRGLIGPRMLLGVSCYADLGRARAARDAGADYVAFGAVRSSSTKPEAVRAPLELFARARALGLPLVAIGGITLDNAADVIAAGADMLAVISDVFDAVEPQRRAAAYAELFGRLADCR
jgi:thiamine-phosphate pyrophosphorylase